jgi:hypothetical protein
MLRRSDRALLNAKETGRNCVVQLGSGSTAAPEKRKTGWFGGRKSHDDVLAEQYLVSEVPLKVSIEKLRGFISDHHGEVVRVDPQYVELKLGEDGGVPNRRSTDRGVRMVMQITLSEEHIQTTRPMTGQRGGIDRTKLHALVRLQRSRDRRRKGAEQQALELLISFRAYLMATEDESPPPKPEENNFVKKTVSLLRPWRKES